MEQELKKPLSSKIFHLLSLSFVISLSIIIYANTTNNEFVYDDESTIVNNSLIKDFRNLPILLQKDYISTSGEMSYRPVVTLTYFLDYALFALNPWGYHLTNIILHAINGALFYIFLTLLIQPSASNNQQLGFMRLLANRPLLMSFLFVTHPVLTETVNAISFREDLLAFLFYIATLNLYISLRCKQPPYKSTITRILFLLSCITYLLSLFSKEIAVTLPLIIYCYEWLYAGKKNRNLNLILPNSYNIGYVIITLVYIYLRFYYFYDPYKIMVTPNWGLSERFFTIPWLFLNYLKLIAFPISLVADYNINPVKSLIDPSFVIPLIGVVSVVVIICKLSKREMTFGALFFIVTLTPVCNIILISNPFAERYIYLPAVGFIIVTGVTINILSEVWSSKTGDRKHYIPIFIFVIISLYSSAVIKRNEAWHNNHLLWSDTVSKMPGSSLAHHNLGVVYYRQGRLNEAISELKASIELRPEDPRSYDVLGNIYDKHGRLDEAAVLFYNAVKLNPKNPNYHFNLANVFYKQTKFDEAIYEYKNALLYDSNNPKYNFNLGITYAEHGRIEEASIYLKTAVKLAPNNQKYRYALSHVHSK